MAEKLTSEQKESIKLIEELEVLRKRREYLYSKSSSLAAQMEEISDEQDQIVKRRLEIRKEVVNLFRLHELDGEDKA